MPDDDHPRHAKPFDRPAAKAAKRRGIAKAVAKTNPAWAAFMQRAGRFLAYHHDYITTDHLELLRIERNGPTTPNDKSFASIMLGLAKDGIIEKWTDTSNSNLKSNHHRPKTVWRSLIWFGLGTPEYKRPRRRKTVDPNLQLWLELERRAKDDMPDAAC